ncbi:hypothetical protein DB30_07184 [Enhygromyxa salina]|uniref:AlgX/AlgJ SGNH hydrolase-like domain-containing protein n=1 Tax=Enhygromyxa salina TaxID=215803 RepID=A0A0C2A642_9BACT|nr:hypothetical protein [Enhygromyxa salina]KIG18848.1 hypothetical protein DB30_07184 [Enhygromyxa salina]
MIAGQLALGLGVGLALTEFAFSTRDHHAFPHVNFYVPDPELGVRLEPGAAMNFKLGSNPLTTITVNSQGYRGREWPAPSEGEVLVIGDSQVFGLGVDDTQTFSAVLAAERGWTVLNAGVPTYGPLEYLALTRELLEQRDATGARVVYVLNFLNDPFELDRPNTQRHAIWDGWAVQIETAPAPGDIVQFPGRKWLMSRSHTVYAARRWWHSRDEAWFARVDRGLPSEGDWSDLLVDSERTHAQLDAAAATALQLHNDSLTHEQRLAEELAAIEAKLDPRNPASVHAKQGPQQLRDDRQREADEDILKARPGGIVRSRYSEAARNITVTAEAYRAALARKQAREQAVAEREALQARAAVLREELGQVVKFVPPEPPDLPRSVFEDHFTELRDLCDSHGAELLIVVLPFDVQVSSNEWAKYGVKDGPDLSPTLALLDDAVASATKLGIPALNVTKTLRDAEPGAFLDGDIHMTPKGHAAFADALGRRLASISQPAPTSESKSKSAPPV